ncbi:MAG: hypothetical protein ACK55Z_01580 [bacterium]
MLTRSVTPVRHATAAAVPMACLLRFGIKSIGRMRSRLLMTF